jgi:DNA-binding NtrC family response regulator
MAKSRALRTILYGEGNREVLASQSALLEKAGYQVKTAMARKGVQEELKNAKFDLVVLGQTLTRDDRHHLPYMVKKANSDSAVLVLHADGARHPAVDGHVDTGSSGEAVLEKILEITGEATLAKPAAAGE